MSSKSDIKKYAAQSAFVFTGKVIKTKAATMQPLAASNTIIAEVVHIINAPPMFTSVNGQQITVRFKKMPSLKAGQLITVFANGWVFGDTIAVDAVGYSEETGKSIAAAKTAMAGKSAISVMVENAVTDNKDAILKELSNLKNHTFKLCPTHLFLLTSFYLLACKKNNKDSGLPPEAYVIESLKLFSVNNVTVPVNYNINGLKIDALAENDGEPGNLFKIQFAYPAGIAVKSVKPDLASAIDFATPQNFEITFDNDLVKTYTVNLKEADLAIESFEVDSVSTYTAQNAWINANYSQSGTDFIGLMSQTGVTNVKIKFNFPKS